MATISPACRSRVAILVSDLRNCAACFRGRIPNALTRRGDSLRRPEFIGEKPIRYFRLDDAHRPYFPRSPAGVRVDLFLRRGPGARFFEALTDVRSSRSLIQQRDNLFAALRLIGGCDSFPNRVKPIAPKLGLARVATLYSYSAISTWGGVTRAPPLAIGDFPVVARPVSDFYDFASVARLVADFVGLSVVACVVTYLPTGGAALGERLFVFRHFLRWPD